MALDNLHNVLLQLLFFFLNEKIFAGRRESKEQEGKKGLLPHTSVDKHLERQLYLIISNL